MPSVKGPFWNFTLNFTGEIPQLVFNKETVQYAIWQHEKAEHDHLQGFLQMQNRNATLQYVRKVFGDLRPHLRNCKINESGRKPWEYASKEETRVAGPWEFGIFIERGSHKRRKIEACQSSPERIKIEDPDLFNRWTMMQKRQQFELNYSGPELNRPWQLILTNYISQEPDDRTIVWVYGPHGGEGKTTFSKELEKNGWFVTSSGRHQDLMYLYVDHGSTSHVCIDFSRSVEEDHFYPLIEDFKNRRIKSSKYKPIKFTELNNIHVIVMANRMPDYCKLSEDRILLIKCDDYA